MVRFGNGVQVDRDNKKEGNGEQEKEKREEGEFDWGYFGVFDGHGGKEGSTFVCNQFHKILLAELGEISKVYFPPLLLIENFFHFVLLLIDFHRTQMIGQKKLLSARCKSLLRSSLKKCINTSFLITLKQCRFVQFTHLPLDHPSFKSFEQGTTATVGFVLKDILYIANVGDSRATLCWGGEAIRISRVHSLFLS